MREIKFRAWDKRGLKIKEVWGINKIRLCLEENAKEFGGGHWEQLEYFELMQYTGLKDVNGREIFEGDILTNDYVFSPVIWDNEKSRYISNSFGLTIKSVRREKLRVIGNVWENPNLLKGEKE